VAADFSATVRPHLDALLEPGEALLGVVAATVQKTFSGGLFALGVTDRRLLLMPLGRKLEPKGDTRSIAPGDLVSAEMDGAGGGWWTAPAAILSASATGLTLRTADGVKTRLMMMKGTGVLGGLGGGEAQSQGVTALAEWMGRRFSAE
jgi:hypothetical protein